MPADAGWVGIAGGGISKVDNSGASGNLEAYAPGMGTGVEERSSLVDTDDPSEGEAAACAACSSLRSRSSRSSRKRMTPPEPTPRRPRSMMLRSVGDLELMMAPIKTRLGSKCGAGIAGRKFSDADVGWKRRSDIVVSCRNKFHLRSHFHQGGDGCASS